MTCSPAPHLPTHDQIAGRAYELFLSRGRQSGHGMDDWLQAEYELIQLPIQKIVELGDEPEFIGQKSNRAVLKKSALVALVQIALALGSTQL